VSHRFVAGLVAAAAVAVAVATPIAARADEAPVAAPAGTSRTALPRVTYDEPFKVVRDRWVVHEAAGLDRAYVYRLIRKHKL
jgi:hypothetical protein